MNNTLKPRVDGLFLSLVIAVAAINLPVFLNIVLPVHDTMDFFHNFYFFYNELYVNGEFAQWVPFGYYGVQSDFFFICQVPPVYYLAGILGYVLRIENAYFLFKAALFFEQLVFLYGVYRLAGITFKRKATVAFVCLASIGGMALMTQLTFNFRTYYLLPFMVYMLLRFFSTYKPQYAFSAALTFIVSLMGTAPYNAPILLLEVVIICPILFLGNLRSIKNIRFVCRGDIIISFLLLFLTVSLTLSYHYFVTHTVDETIILTTGRDPMTGATNLHTFLTYGGDINWDKFSGLWSPGYRIKTALPADEVFAFDETIYFGAIPFALFLYGLLVTLYVLFVKRKFPNPLYLAVLLLAVVLALLSVGHHTFFATFLYKWFPFMKYYRHVGFVTASFKFLIPLLAGFGFEHFITRMESESGKRRFLWESAIVSVFVLSIVFIADSFKHVMPDSEALKAVIAYSTFAVLVVVAMAILRARFKLRSHIIVLVIVLYLVEVIGYQFLVDITFIQFGRGIKPVNEEVFYVERYRFQPARTMNFPTRRAQAAFPFVYGTTTYAFGYNFMQWDPCTPKTRVHFLNENVNALFTLWGDPLNFMRLKLPDIPFLFIATGCDTSKLRLVSDVVIADGVRKATDIIKGSSIKDTAVVISDGPEEILQEWKNKPHPARAAGNIAAPGFRANGLDLNVEVLEGPLWLYYADAYHSGWRATVNGEPQEISRANIAFKALLLPEGQSTVRFFFDGGASYRAALVIIAIGTLVMAALLVFVIRALFFATRDEGNKPNVAPPNE
jgi:hypothetical protein